MNDRPSYPDRYQKLYTMLLDAIPSSILLINPGLKIVSANRNFLNKSQRSLNNTLGLHIQQVFPEGILGHTNIMDQIQAGFRDNRLSRGERISYRAPGLPMRFYYYRIIPFEWLDKVEMVMLLMDDVTQQVHLHEEVRRVERHLASIVESASDIVLSTDMNGYLLTWNSAAEKLSGYSSTEVLNRPFFEYCTDKAKDEAKQVFEELCRSNRPQHREWHLKTAKGAAISVSWVCSPMKNDQAETIGMVAVGRDLTEQRKLEMQLAQSQKLAALGVMAGGIAHEIRNPLAICSSAAQFLLEEDIEPEFIKECATKIQGSISKASLIIENLLRFARPSTTPLNEAAPLDLNSLLTDTLSLIANQAAIRKVASHYHPPFKPVVINGIPNLLQQVFMNLLINAINAMPEGGRIDVDLEQVDHEAVVRVTDTGLGIPESVAEQVFDPFFTTSTIGQGTGLGLSISYSIVKEHHGSIGVESQEGHGSTFTVRLPISPDKTVVQPQA